MATAMNSETKQPISNKELAERYAGGDQTVYQDVLRLSLAEGMTLSNWVFWYTGKRV